jgi:hypothetical protein
LASWTLAGDAEEYRLSQERRSLLYTLGAAGGGMAPKEIAEALDKSVGSVKVLLGEMVKAGQVTNPTYGRYDLPDDTPYSPYPAYSSNGGGAKSKEGKRSKRDAGGASVVCVHGFSGGGGVGSR